MQDLHAKITAAQAGTENDADLGSLGNASGEEFLGVADFGVQILHGLLLFMGDRRCARSAKSCLPARRCLEC